MKKSLLIFIMSICLFTMIGCGTIDTNATPAYVSSDSGMLELSNMVYTEEGVFVTPTPKVLKSKDIIVSGDTEKESQDNLDYSAPEEITSIPEEIVTPTSIPTPAVEPTITPTTEPTPEASWILSEDGEIYRYTKIANYFGIDIEYAPILINAYYYFTAQEVDSTNYTVEDEETAINDWLNDASDELGLSFESTMIEMLSEYCDYYLTANGYDVDTGDYYVEHYDDEDDDYDPYTVSEEDDPMGLLDYGD